MAPKGEILRRARAINPTHPIGCPPGPRDCSTEDSASFARLAVDGHPLQDVTSGERRMAVQQNP